MSSVEDRYYKLNRILLKIVGLWPYQNSKWIHVQAAMITSLYLSILFVQLAVFITHECTLNIVLDVFSLIIPNIFILLLHNIYYFKIDFFKELMDNMFYDWKSLKDNAELTIMDDYASISKMCTQMFSFGCFIAIIVLPLTHVGPLILDIVLPLNESRPQKIHMIVEYFVDPYKYHYFLAFHLTFTVCLGMITGIATSSMFLNFCFHVCAMFRIVNYRMEIMMDKNILRIPSPEKEHVIFERIIYAVDFHRRSVQFYRLFISNLEKSFLIVLIFGVVSLSINLFRLLQAITMFNGITDIILSAGLSLIHLCYIFFSSHIGQQVTDEHANIFNTIYNLPWYLAPPNVQRLILFLLLKGNQIFYLSIEDVFNASHESFTTLINASISYLTIIYSLQ